MPNIIFNKPIWGIDLNKTAIDLNECEHFLKPDEVTSFLAWMAPWKLNQIRKSYPFYFDVFVFFNEK